MIDISVLCLVRCFFCWSISVSSIFLPLCTLSIFLSKIQRQGMYAWDFLTNISAMVYPLFLSPVTIFGGRKVAWNIAFLLFGTGEPHLLLLSLSWNHSNFFLYSLLVWNCFLYSSDETETSGLSFLCPTLNVQHPQMETSPIGKLTMIPPTQQSWASNC